MIQIVFGICGCGKTTYACKVIKKAVKRYPNVYGNFHAKIDGYTYIDNECIGKFNLDNSLIIVDEASNFADSRDFKNFSKSLMRFMNEHRHHHVDIIFLLQKWDALDIKIRNICERVYMLKRSIMFPFLSYKYLIPYGIDFVNPKVEGRHYGDIFMGYARPRLSNRIFKEIIFRPAYYKYFDSWECDPMPPLPPKYIPYEGELTIKDELLNFYTKYIKHIFKHR